MATLAAAFTIDPPAPAPTAADPSESARAAGLRYVSDEKPGIRRRRSGTGWAYLDPAGKVVGDTEDRARIRALAIPPAWTDVWICPRADGHIQATGRDARGRKQYRYHPDWRAVRDETKFGRMAAFAEALPALRARIDADLSLRGMPREKVLAAVVRLLELTLIRVGNDEYARANDSYGLTTLRSDHVDVDGSVLRFRFRGKSGVTHELGVRDRRVARIVERCQDLPGEELFEYLDDDGEPRRVSSDDVNDYLREATGQDFTAKDFRTWGGTVLALFALRRMGPPEGAAEAKKNVVEAVKQVARALRNRPATCRKFYIHPAVLAAYLEGDLAELASRAEADPGERDPFRRLEAETLAVLNA